MIIFGSEQEEYLGLWKNPFILYIALVVGLSLLSFISFDAYLEVSGLSGISTLIYLGVAAYVGWNARKKGMGTWNAVFAGLALGFAIGAADIIAHMALLYFNPNYAATFDQLIQSVIANSVSSGSPMTWDEAWVFVMIFVLLLNLVISAIILGLLAGAVSLAVKYLAWKPAESGGAGKIERERNKPGKKFRRKR